MTDPLSPKWDRPERDHLPNACELEDDLFLLMREAVEARDVAWQERVGAALDRVEDEIEARSLRHIVDLTPEQADAIRAEASK